MQKVFSFKSSTALLFLFVLLFFNFSKLSTSAQAPMTVFGVVPSSTASVKVFVGGTFCKDANVLPEPNSSTGYIFLAYIDEGECNAFADSLVSFNLNGEESKQTILWRKGGAPESATGLNLTVGENQDATTNKKDEQTAAESTKKSLPTLPGPAEKPKEESEKKNTESISQSKKPSVAPDDNKTKNEQSDAKQASPTNVEVKKQPITKNATTTQVEEKQTIVENKTDGSNRNTILFAGLATVLVLLGFYSLARR